ncbi:conserved hypothetical protein [Klebsiella pneumoniae]|nr:hypothetical protein UUU_31990 [Klebsiella pneumoniae subsp. pneumoniae DSM 30104 = JCM 1662 = NBRC 14940]SAL91184.1 conserved hypothetical protein [Klebsiella pneumoniae]
MPTKTPEPKAMHNTGEQIALQTDEHYVSNVYNRRPTQR